MAIAGLLYPEEAHDVPEEEKVSDKGSKKDRSSMADRLVALALQGDTVLFHDETEEPYARLLVRDHWETWRVRSKGFKRWLAHLFWDHEGKAANSDAMNSALNVIEARAYFQGQRYPLYNRLASHDEAIWYDLADEQWRAVRITKEGWGIVGDPPLLFRRYDHQQAQVNPIPNGDIHKILDFVSVADDQHKLLLLVYLVTCFVPDIPHPLPILHGPQGSAKTTTFRLLKRLIDPSIVDILSFPKDINELIQKLSHHWTAYFDNVTRLPDWISDALCRAVTGEGFSKRQLYTDDDDVLYSFKRCLGLNGVNVAAHRPDLLDRAILFELSRIPPDKRRPEQAIWRSFEHAREVILGGVFDLFSEAIKHMQTINVSQLPRMADFTLWGCAIAEALGEGQEAFLTAYFKNLKIQNEEVLQSHPVAQVILTFMQDRTVWKGTPSTLLEELNMLADTLKINTNARDWPKAANSLTRRLNEIKANLQDEGIMIDTTGRADDSTRTRQITIQKSTDQTVQTVQPSESQQWQGSSSDGFGSLSNSGVSS
ncbi:MAG: hypothetical protein HY731_04455, partial [Candidatus Tectomicrobia bacterium]|nr:hypothetical protein [Candidatus Tectomicrobia bacterium]